MTPVACVAVFEMETEGRDCFSFFFGGGGGWVGGAGGLNEDLLGAFWRDLVLAHFFDRGFINAQM